MTKKQKTQQTITIEKFTCTYDYKEDRLRLVLNYQDPVNRADFWVTRSFLLKLLPIFSKFSCNIDDVGIVNNDKSNIQQPEARSTTDTTDESLYYLTQKEPMLLEQVNFTKNNEILNVTFSGDSGAKYITSLNIHDVDSMSKMLVNSAPTYEWGIGPWML
jgi:hypothetical protein